MCENHNNRYIEIREYVQDKIRCIEDIRVDEFRHLCLLSLLERFAQEWANYPTRESEKVFCDFILRYQRSYSWIKDYNPITMYYCYESKLSTMNVPQMLSDGCKYTPVNIRREVDINHLLTRLEEAAVTPKAMDSHRYVNLLYKMRNKISHEGYLSCWTKIASLWDEELPCFVNMGLEKNAVWHFAFPYSFTKAITIECIDNFINEREKDGKDPFENNTDDRKHSLTWVSAPKTYEPN